MIRQKAFGAGVAVLLGAALLADCGNRQEKFALKDPQYGSPAAQLSRTTPTDRAYYSGPGLSIAPEVKPLVNASVADVRLDVVHSEIQINDSVKYIAWTFGGAVPGPVIHIRQGGKVHFTLTNRSNETIALTPPMTHSLDFHAAMVNPEDKYQNVIPGGALTYDWTANYPGVFMYHCATAPVLQHLAYGMIGMVIVDPQDDYPTAVDREYALVQSELYLKKGRNGGYDIDMDSARAKQPSFVVFNGKPGQYAKTPLAAKPGERVRLYVLNAGPNGTSSFHVIGTIMDRVWLDGNPVNELRGMQTVLLGAASSAIVEFIIPEAGTYTFVDHEFADAEKGAAGMIAAR